MPLLGKIKVLDKLTAEHIAAGEVIESPASVVKELIENALDAGARKITVELEEGGLKKITVADDGCGMSQEDALQALKRHATSKIRSTEDLFRISTLGFRGEALSSIAAVSYLKITTRVPEELDGISVCSEGGTVKSVEPAGCPPGTTVTVGDIFYNTPARRKFLKGAKAEARRVVEIVEHLAISQPGVRFELKSDGQQKIRTSGSGNLLETLASIHGINLARKLVKINGAIEGATLTGYISRPELNRSTRKYQDMFINKRYIKNTYILRSLEEAYRGFLPKGRYPLAFLFLKIPLSEVDVNVHPGKLEVRLHREREIKNLVYRTVKQRLQGGAVIPEFEVNSKRRVFENKSDILWREKLQQNRGDNYLVPNCSGMKKKVPEKITREITGIGEKTNTKSDKTTDVTIKEVNFKEETLKYPENSTEAQIFQLKVVGQVSNLYIIACGTDGVYILDQHAAHERIIYEKFQRTMEQDIVKSQMLAVPVTLEMSRHRTELLLKNIVLLRETGFILEEFGDTVFRLCGVPQGLEPGEEEGLIDDILDLLEEREIIIKKSSIKESILATMACKKAVKSGERLSREAMKVILDELFACENPYTCPHGRPTMIRLSFEELSKKFKRT